MFRVSWLGISWCHDVWIFRKLKFDYVRNEKSFRSEIKKELVSFRHTKRTSKNLADTTFKVQKLGDSFTLFAKRFCAVFFCFSMPSFVAWILWPELRIYWQGVWFFDKVENIIQELRWSANIDFSVTNFCWFWYFAGSDFKIVLLGQNNFEWIAFC